MFIIRNCFLRFCSVLALASSGFTFASSQVEAQRYSAVPFAFNSKSLPTHYIGHDAERVYNAIHDKHEIVRGEYETSAEFTRRYNKAQSKALYGAMHITDTFAFSLSRPGEFDNKAFSVSYDADNGMLNVSPTFDCSDDIGAVFDAKYREDEGGTYSGTNAFGVARTVNRSIDTKYSIVIDNAEEFNLQPTDISAKKIVIRLFMSPDVARRVKPQVDVIAVCTINSSDNSGITAKAFAQTPTLDDPTDHQTTNYYIIAAVKEFVVFDQSTGRVLSIVKAKPSPNDVVPQMPEDTTPLTPLEKANLRKYQELMDKP